MQDTKRAYFKSGVHFVIGAILLTLFFWTLIEGLITQVTIGDHKMSLAYYALSFLAGLVTYYNISKAKTLFHYAKLA